MTLPFEHIEKKKSKSNWMKYENSKMEHSQHHASSLLHDWIQKVAGLRLDGKPVLNFDHVKKQELQFWKALNVGMGDNSM